MQFVIPVVSMAAMSVIVALVLALVHKFLTVEGEAKVKIANDGNSLTLPLGANLMKSLQEAGYALFAQCGGKGTCATCRVKPLEGFSEPTPAQLGPLSPKLRKEGWVLSCQINLNSDLVIELFKPLVLSWPKVIARPEETAKPKEAEVALSPLAAKIRDVLPGFDCDACGYPTCEEYAEAVAGGKASFDRCLPGGRPVLERVKSAVIKAQS